MCGVEKLDVARDPGLFEETGDNAAPVAIDEVIELAAKKIAGVDGD
jgi:hypothetical protein